MPVGCVVVVACVTAVISVQRPSVIAQSETPYSARQFIPHSLPVVSSTVVPLGWHLQSHKLMTHSNRVVVGPVGCVVVTTSGVLMQPQISSMIEIKGIMFVFMLNYATFYLKVWLVSFGLRRNAA